MMNTSGSEKTCTPILSYFVSWSRLIVFSLLVVRSWFDCTKTQKADLFSFQLQRKVGSNQEKAVRGW